MSPRRFVVSLAAVVLAPLAVAALPSSPALGSPGTVVVHRHLPRGEDPAVPWLDRKTRVIHAGDRTIRLRMPGYVDDFRRSGRSFVVHVSRDRPAQERLYLVGSGKTRLLTERLSGDYQLSAFPRGQVAYQAFAPGTHSSYQLRVLDLHDGSVVARQRVPAKVQPLAFRDGFVWRNLGTGLGTWNPLTDTLSFTGLQASAAIDLVHGIAAVPYDGGTTITYYPMFATERWTPWTTKDPGVLGWSSDGRLVATYTRGREDGSAGRVVLRNAETGRPVRIFLPDPHSTFYVSSVRWEGTRRILVPADAGLVGTRQTVDLVRMRIDGSYDAASDGGGDHTSPVIPALPGNGPPG